MSYTDAEPPQDFTAPDGTRWRRTGYCCRCGECCVGDPETGSDERMCPFFALVWDKKREGYVGSCVDRKNPYYLNGCNVWPSEPDHIRDKPSCTYIFTQID